MPTLDTDNLPPVAENDPAPVEDKHSSADSADKPRTARHLLPSRRWIDVHISREAIISHLKTLAWVVPLTCLIWVYAEREQVADERNIAFPIDVRNTDLSRLVTLINPPDKNLIADLQGPRQQIEELKRELVPTGSTAPVQIEVDPALRPGEEYQLLTLPQLTRNPLFSGITINSVQPASLTVRIERMVEKTLPVEAPPGLPSLDAATSFDPPVARIRAPESLLKQAQRDAEARGTHLAIYADVANLPVLKVPGQHNLDVPLVTPIHNEHVTLTPTTVHALLKVRQADKVGKISSMPIFLAGPNDMWGKYKVVFPMLPQPFLTNVPVIGPPDKIDLLDKEGFAGKAKAILEVTANDLPTGEVHLRRPRFELPDDIKPGPGAEDIKVEFKLVETNALP